MKKEFQRLQKSYEKLIKKKEKGVVQNYKNSYKRLRKKLEKIYDKYEKEGQLDFDDLRRYKELRRLDVITANIMISLYKDNEKLIKSTLKQIYDKTIEVSISHSIVPVKKKIDPTKVIEREVAGRIWTERTKHYGNNFVYDVHSIIKEGLSRGDTYTTMAKNLENRFGEDIGNTVRIARTEGARVLEDTKFNTFEEINKSPNVKVVKVWHTMSDERVRDTHQAMEGVEVDFDKEFTLPSGATCMYPKSSGVPSEDINCRCYCEYKTVVISDDLGYNKDEPIETQSDENIRAWIKSHDKKLNHEKYEEHNKNSKRYDGKKSYLIISEKETQKLINKKAGTGELLIINGVWTKKEFIERNEVLGIYKNLAGKELETKRCIVTYKNNGKCHIVPSNPNRK